MSQKEDFEWFKKNFESVINGHLGQSVVISNGKVIGYYPSDRLALEAMKDAQEGSFIVQRCLPQETSDFVYYTGRFAF